MQKVTFSNKGLIDPISIGTFGINAKDNDNAIGFFGTGLKYAIAVLLREGIHFTVQAGEQKHTFSLLDKTIRNKTFSVICMDDTPLGFTTELGKKWELWQAFRELYCNTMDENGSVTDESIKHSTDSTTITVYSDRFHNIYTNSENIILDSPTIYKTDRCSIHYKQNNNFVFYKNIRIYDGFNPGRYTYNILSDINITEDRTAKYEFQMKEEIANAILKSEDHSFIQDTITAGKEFLEDDLNFDVSGKPSATFLNVAYALRLNVKLNATILPLLKRNSISLLPQQTTLTSIQSEMLRRACIFCNRIGYPVDNYPIIPSNELKSGLLGLALDEKIYISIDTFGHGTKFLASTLIEEFLHLDTGYGDMTRQLQNRLFNDIVSLGEQVIGEPV